jgi:hypothetical protein
MPEFDEVLVRIHDQLENMKKGLRVHQPTRNQNEAGQSRDPEKTTGTSRQADEERGQDRPRSR